MKTITEIRYSNFLDIIENEVSSIRREGGMWHGGGL